MNDHDQQLGLDRAPDRYSRGNRETIDQIRDAMTDAEFVAFCRGNVIRYRDRAGAKGPAEVDETKAQFYERMAEHVAGNGPDPRASRPGFVAYVREDASIALLDHGYIRLVETWGSDARVVEAARMSTGKGFLGWGTPDEPGDEKLLRYLWERKHATPFEMAGMVVEVQAPIFVFREWHRHRTQSYNEMSARYTPLPDLNYIPTVGRLMINAGGTNRQAGTIGGAETLSLVGAEQFRDALAESYSKAESLYQGALRCGVPKELARVHLPVGRYSRMRASANLRNWLAFLTLRMAPDAQWEIRQYANAVGTLIGKAFPRTWELGAPR
jgi:thymidylate synthase (FAD)